MAGLPVSPLVASEPPQIVPTTSSDGAIGTRGDCASAPSVGLDPVAALLHRAARAACRLDADQAQRPARVLDRLRRARAG